MLFPELRQPSDRPALRVGDDEVSHTRLAGSAARLATELAGCDRVAVWAENSIATGVATVAALIAGVPAIPVNPKVGQPRARAHPRRLPAGGGVVWRRLEAAGGI